MIAVDSSIVVAAFSSWHERHEQARVALSGGAQLVGHAAFEAYSVLTRLPKPHRAPPQTVLRFLATRFPDPYLVLDADRQRELLGRLPSLGLVGGAAYDALIAATASDAGLRLVSCDLRAALAYSRCGVAVDLI